MDLAQIGMEVDSAPMRDGVAAMKEFQSQAHSTADAADSLGGSLDKSAEASQGFEWAADTAADTASTLSQQVEQAAYAFKEWQWNASEAETTATGLAQEFEATGRAAGQAAQGVEHNSTVTGKLTGVLQTYWQRLKQVVAEKGNFIQKSREMSAAGDATIGKIKNMISSFGALKSTLVGAAAALAIREIAAMADTWSDATARIGVATGSMDVAEGVMDRLAHTAQITYSSLNQTVEGFVRNSTVLQALGKTTEEQIAYTEALNLALVASGTKGQQALSVQEALSKGMTQGKLATEQLQTVLNGSSEVSKALAEELGTTVLGLSSLATQGQITGDVIFRALTKRLDEFTDKAAEMPTTIGDGFLLIGNALTVLVGKFDQFSGVSLTVANALASVAEAIMWVANNGETVGRILWTLVPAMIAVFGPTVYAMVAGLATIIGKGLVGAVALLWSTITKHPIGALATAAATLVMYLFQWRDSFPAIGRMFDWLQEKAISVLTKIRDAFKDIPFLSWVGDAAEWAIEIIGDDAADKISKAHEKGGTSVANKIKDAHENGGKNAADEMRRIQDEAAQRAIQQYEIMNGKAVKTMGETLVKSAETGAEYMYNAVTGSVRAVTEEMKSATTEAVKASAQTAGGTIGNSMTSAGEVVGRNLYDVMVTAGDRMMASGFERMEEWAKRMITVAAHVENSLKWAEAGKLIAEAEAIRQSTKAQNRTGSGGSSAGGGSSSGSSSSGYASNFFGPAAFAGSQAWDKYNERFSDNKATTPESKESKPQVTIKNITDPKSMVDMLGSEAAHNQITNYIKHNKEEVKAILGAY